MRPYIYAFLFALLMLIACSLDGQNQCQGLDTIPPGPPHPPYNAKTHLGSPVPCYTPCRPCSTSVSVAVFPLANGAIIIGGDSGQYVLIVRDSCDLILWDTCITVTPSAQTQIYRTYPAYTIWTLCRDTISAVSVFYKPFSQVGPPLDTLADYDTLAPCPPLALDRPRFTTPTEGYTDMLGRYWPTLDGWQVPAGIYFSWADRCKVLKLE